VASLLFKQETYDCAEAVSIQMHFLTVTVRTFLFKNTLDTASPYRYAGIKLSFNVVESLKRSSGRVIQILARLITEKQFGNFDYFSLCFQVCIPYLRGLVCNRQTSTMFHCYFQISLYIFSLLLGQSNKNKGYF